MANREKLGGYLQDRRWMARVLDRTYQQSHRLADWGYPYPVDDHGRSQRNSLQGPEYMRLMRKRTKQAGVTILDHSPALELLVDGGAGILLGEHLCEHSVAQAHGRVAKARQSKALEDFRKDLGAGDDDEEADDERHSLLFFSSDTNGFHFGFTC